MQLRGIVLYLLLTCLHVVHAEAAKTEKPVDVIATQLLKIPTSEGQDVVPIYASVDGAPVDLDHVQDSVTRVLIVFHGRLRNADVYNSSGLRAIASAGDTGRGTLLITPQFLAQVDVDKFHLSAKYLRWKPDGWMGGANAQNAEVSSFHVIDIILSQLTNRKRFPNLRTVVLAGHSAGAQVLQRYAVIGREGDALVAHGLSVRYIIANPSSYVYFSPERPSLESQAKYSFTVPRNTCSGLYNHWKYGVIDLPPYASGTSIANLELKYTRRNVLYLLGTEDIDPNQSALDKSCSAEDEGPFRFFRGKAYFSYLADRHPELRGKDASQQLWFVPGVEHDGDKMFNSPCGLSALFETDRCASRVTEPTP